jgi:anaerobic selenocysteine-containing dehydrogenase
MLDTIQLKRRIGSRKGYQHQIQVCCQECSAGCGLWVYVKDDRIVDIQGNPDHPLSRGRLCARGIAFVQGVNDTRRITIPATRNRSTGPFEAFDNWEKGIDLLAERLRRIKEQHGPASLVIGCDPEAGLDFFLGAQRFARLWGTPHVYHPMLEAADSKTPLETGHPTLPSSDWSQCRTILLVEADLAGTHPVTFGRLLEAQRQGATLISIDTRFTTTLAKSDRHLVIRPGSGNLLGALLTKQLLEADALKLPPGGQPEKDFDAWRASYASMAPEAWCEAVGADPHRIGEIAKIIGHVKPGVIITGKRLAYSADYGVWSTLAQVLGWEWYPMESGSPILDPVSDLDEVAPPASESRIGVLPYQSRDGIHPEGWETDLKERGFRALIGSGNCLNDFFSPFQSIVIDLDLIVYFGGFPNRTRQMSHMVFPATTWVERDGIGFTDDGWIQWSPKVVKAGDACRTGLGFWMRLADRFGWGDHFPWKKANGLADQPTFYKWLLKQSRETAHVCFEEIHEGKKPVNWLWPPQGDQERKTELMPAPVKEPSKVKGTEDPKAYPFDFQATRIITRSSDASRWWPWTREMESDEAVQVHPFVAETLGIETGQPVIVTSPHETMEGKAVVSRTVPPRTIWSPQRMRADRVLVYPKGQSPQEARDRLDAANF